MLRPRGQNGARYRAVTGAGGNAPLLNANFLAGVLPAGFNFSRSSNATMVGRQGGVVWAPHNLLGYTSDLGNMAGWSRARVSDHSAENNIASPDGAMSAVFLKDAAVSGDHYIARGVGFAVPSGATMTLSVYAKGGRGRNLRVQGKKNDGTTYPGANFDLLTGATSSLSGVTRAVATPVGDGWFRLEITYDTGAGASTPVAFLMLTNGSSVNFTGDGESGAYLWGAQLEMGSVASPYLPVSGAGPLYAPRFEHDPATKAPLGLLVEGQGTNANPNSEVAVGGFAAISTAAPSFGDFRMTRLTGDGSSATHGGIFPSATPAANSLVTLSCVAKAVSGNGLIQLTGSGSWLADVAQSFANFNLLTGQITLVGSAAQNAAILPLGDGYYRISVTLTTSATPSSATSLFVNFLTTGLETRAPMNTSTAAFDVGLGQHEAGPFCTSYIPTYGSAATRAADNCSAPTAGWLDPNQGTLLVEFDRQSIPTSSLSYNPIVAILRNTATTRLALLCGSGTPAQQRFDVVDGGASQAAIAGANGAPGAAYRMAAAWAANDFRMAQNGTLGTPDTSGVVPQGVTGLEVGNYGTGSPLNGRIRRVAYYRTPLTNERLVSLTT